MPKRIDLSGKRFGKLIVIKYSHTDKGKAIWECACDCGAIKNVKGDCLNYGNTKSCGCLKSETSTIHGKSSHRLYGVWRNMKARCNNKHNKAYENYGLRGIKVCKEWSDSFASFHSWAISNGYDKNAPYKECTIERVDSNLGYCPTNCKFAGVFEQNQHTRIRKDNKSGVKGVTWDKRRHRWCAEIRENLNKHFLGYFDDLEEAAIARRNAEMKYWGHYAPA